MMLGFMRIHLIFLAISICCANLFAQVSYYNVSGRVIDARGTPISGVTVTLGGSQSAIIQTDNNGNYSFGNLAQGGTYSVSPSKVGSTFSQPTKTLYNLSADRTVNFTEVAYYTISGRVAEASSIGISDVTIVLGGSESAMTTTDSSGNYSCVHLPMGGTYTVTPSKDGFAFTQPSKTFYNLTDNRTANFVQLAFYNLTGRVTDGTYSVSGVTMTLAGALAGTSTSDVNGNYSFANLSAGGNYTVTPSKTGMKFNITSKNFFNLGASLTTNFIASINPEDLTGRLLKYTNGYVLQHFDSASGMLYDSTGRLSVRDTMIAALLWSEVGNMTLTERAVSAVLDTQILNRDDPQFGNFPNYPGEAPVDTNWSAFIGSYLITLQERHREETSAQLNARILNAIGAAAEHRLQVRKELHRTNIAILSSFVLIRAGELLGNAQLFQQGKTFWQSFVAFTDSGGIAEYNSPNYFKVDLYGLGFLTDYVNDSQVVADAARLRRLFWWSITQHYHSPTFQLAGPFSRAITERMVYEPTGIQAFIYRDSLGQIPLFDSQQNFIDDTTLHTVLPVLVHPSWPQEWVQQALIAPQVSRQFREQTKGPASLQPGAFQQITTYFGPNLTVGSVNKDQIGAQQRPLIAYAKGANGSDVGVFKLFVAGPTLTTFVMGVQQMNSVLVVVSGDTYDVSPPLQMNVRLQWFGTVGRVPYFEGNTRPTVGGNFDVQWMNVPVAVRMADSALQNLSSVSLTWQQGDISNPLEVRLVATLPQVPEYRGRNVYPAFPLVLGIYFGDSVNVSSGSLAPIVLTPSNDNGAIRVSWSSPNGLLEMQFPNVPGQWSSDQWINSQPIVAQPLTPPQ